VADKGCCLHLKPMLAAAGTRPGLPSVATCTLPGSRHILLLQEDPAQQLLEVPVEMPKASDADKEHFRSVIPDHPDIVIKPMFGNLGAFVNGNMFAGLFGPTIGVKLAEADKEELESTERTVPFGPPERPMGGYTGLPEIWNAEGAGDEARAKAWVEKAFEHVSTLPPKAPKSTTAPKAKAAKK
jgi:hypothetical protein